jgi:hypothetical protein
MNNYFVKCIKFLGIINKELVHTLYFTVYIHMPEF